MVYVKLKKLILIMFFASTLCSCGPKAYVDVSNHEDFRDFIGKEIEALIDLKAHGVTFELVDSKTVDYVIISSPPGFTGRHVLFKKDFKSGTLLEITGFVNSGYFSFLEKYYKVKVLNNTFYHDYIVLIPVSESIKNENLGLSATNYRVK